MMRKVRGKKSFSAFGTVATTKFLDGPSFKTPEQEQDTKMGKKDKIKQGFLLLFPSGLKGVGNTGV